jgi:AmiR/NasT family two-component response regulator
LNLFRDKPGRLAASDVPLGQGMADIAAVALLQERIVRESRGVIQQLQGALTSRVVIEQAKGVLAERAGIGVDEAFARMRAHARGHNVRLSDLACALIDGELDVSALQPSSG